MSLSEFEDACAILGLNPSEVNDSTVKEAFRRVLKEFLPSAQSGEQLATSGLCFIIDSKKVIDQSLIAQSSDPATQYESARARFGVGIPEKKSEIFKNIVAPLNGWGREKLSFVSMMGSEYTEYSSAAWKILSASAKQSDNLTKFVKEVDSFVQDNQTRKESLTSVQNFMKHILSLVSSPRQGMVDGTQNKQGNLSFKRSQLSLLNDSQNISLRKQRCLTVKNLASDLFVYSYEEGLAFKASLNAPIGQGNLPKLKENDRWRRKIPFVKVEESKHLQVVTLNRRIDNLQSTIDLFKENGIADVLIEYGCENQSLFSKEGLFDEGSWKEARRKLEEEIDQLENKTCDKCQTLKIHNEQFEEFFDKNKISDLKIFIEENNNLSSEFIEFLSVICDGLEEGEVIEIKVSKNKENEFPTMQCFAPMDSTELSRLIRHHSDRAKKASNLVLEPKLGRSLTALSVLAHIADGYMPAYCDDMKLSPEMFIKLGNDLAESALNVLASQKEFEGIIGKRSDASRLCIPCNLN